MHEPAAFIKHHLYIILPIAVIAIAVCAFMQVNMSGSHTRTVTSSITSGRLRHEAYALVSSAKNSTTDYADQYGYIEDIKDGRGYTGGIIGFTSATGDMLAVVQRYADLGGTGDVIDYMPALKALAGTDSHQGLDPGFPDAWKRAAADPLMIKAQDQELDERYMEPAVQAAEEDGLSPLGQYIYYDAIVVHGEGDDGYAAGFDSIRKTALSQAKPPADGGDERAFLLAFLDARAKVMKQEEAHSDLSRLETQRSFVNAGNYGLDLPLHWKMYGDSYTLTKRDVE